MKLFISSHGRLASGFKSSLQILFGPCDYITVFDAYLDDRSVQEELERFYETVREGEQVILLSDLYGSSVNQAMCMYAGRPDTTLIASANLALVMGLAGRESITREELEELVEQSRQLLQIVDMEPEETDRQDEEFF